MTKYLFLDFDGVLNTTQHQAQCNVLGFPDSDKYGLLFSPSAVRSLQNLIDETGAEIVIISSWRYIHSNQKLREMWQDRNLPATNLHFLDSNRNTTNLSKGEQIANFMLSPPNNPYVILDDEPEEFPAKQFSHLILINPVTGLKKGNVDEAIKILNNKS